MSIEDRSDTSYPEDSRNRKAAEEVVVIHRKAMVVEDSKKMTGRTAVEGVTEKAAVAVEGLDCCKDCRTASMNTSLMLVAKMTLILHFLLKRITRIARTNA